MKRRLGPLLVLLLMVAVFVAPALLGERTPITSGGVGDRQAGGHRAAYVLLRELGLAARRWGEAPVGLADEHGVLWMSSPPDSFDPGADDPGAPLGSVHDPARYLEFCERGGTLVCVGTDGARFLGLALGLRPYLELDAHLIATRAGPTGLDFLGVHYEGDLPEHGAIETDAVDRLGLEPLVAGERGTFAVRLPVGTGAAVWLASDDFLDNDRIALGDNALVAVRLVERLGRGEEVLFDEYALGAWRATSLGRLVTGPRLGPLTWHLAALALLGLWAAAWVRGFPREPLEWRSRSPLARARAAVALRMRARRHDMVGRDLVQLDLARMARALRLVPRASTDHDLALERLLAAAGRGREVDAWRADLFPPASRPADLERLDARLAELERSAASGEPR